jgi:hypothetical protein
VWSKNRRWRRRAHILRSPGESTWLFGRLGVWSLPGLLTLNQRIRDYGGMVTEVAWGTTGFGHATDWGAEV